MIWIPNCFNLQSGSIFVSLVDLSQVKGETKNSMSADMRRHKSDGTAVPDGRLLTQVTYYLTAGKKIEKSVD